MLNDEVRFYVWFQIEKQSTLTENKKHGNDLSVKKLIQSSIWPRNRSSMLMVH